METPAAVWLGPKLHIIIDKPEDMQTVLLSPNCLDKPYVYRFLPNERGLFTSEGISNLMSRNQEKKKISK